MIVERVGLRCELDFLILTPVNTGSPLNNGDLDNKLKILIDGLRQPNQPTEVTAEITDNTFDVPLFVLLEDDRLVTKISVQTDLLLELPGQPKESRDVKVIIDVHLFPVVPGWGTISLIG